MDDVEAIKQLKARYFRTMDTKDWAAMRGVFTDDVVMDTTEAGGDVTSGADRFIAFLREAIGSVITVHHGHMPEIELTGADTATGIWAMYDFVDMPQLVLHGWGHYHEEYAKQNGAISAATMKRTFVVRAAMAAIIGSGLGR